ncbi:hypothetical protein PR048_009533 [Dryococelus australis]|uniref:Uncharacterized protein n=1 Tax=Dryococelus australis TaxID=614101 RepID=A0ABQ9I059_9NEOP|nr:hypothetical protein PR048_009533 [Dryococelus australis]
MQLRTLYDDRQAVCNEPRADKTEIRGAHENKYARFRKLRSATARLPPRRTGFNPRPDHSGFSQVGIVPDDASFLEDLPFPSPLHSGAAQCSPHLTLIGSQDPSVKNHTNIFTHSYFSFGCVGPPPGNTQASFTCLAIYGAANIAREPITLHLLLPRLVSRSKLPARLHNHWHRRHSHLGENLRYGSVVSQLRLQRLVVKRYDGNTARLARWSDEALGVRVSVARISPSLLDLGRWVPTGIHPILNRPN